MRTEGGDDGKGEDENWKSLGYVDHSHGDRGKSAFQTTASAEISRKAAEGDADQERQACRGNGDAEIDSGRPHQAAENVEAIAVCAKQEPATWRREHSIHERMRWRVGRDHRGEQADY